MNIPYLASRNHSSRFSFAGSGGFGDGVCAVPLTTATAPKSAGKIDLRINAPSWLLRILRRPSYPSASEIEAERHLQRARRARRAADAVGGAEVGVHLRARRVEARGAVDVLELHRVEHVVRLETVLE